MSERAVSDDFGFRLGGQPSRGVPIIVRGENLGECTGRTGARRTTG